MTILPLGPDILKPLLQGNGRVTIANRAPDDSGVVVLGAVVVRHDSSGVASRQAFLGLDLRSDEAEAIEPAEATDEPFEGVEVLLRVSAQRRFGIRDLYVASQPDSPPALQWEAGLRVDDGAIEDGEIAVPEGGGFLVYLRPIR